MKGSSTNENRDRTEGLEKGKNANEEQTPYIMTGKELLQYIRRKLPKWIQEVRRLRGEECSKK